MNLKEKIEADFAAAVKSRDTEKVSVLRLLKTAIKNEEINQKEELSDDDILKILKREVKQRKDSIEEYQKGNREDLAEKEKREIKIIKQYMPEEISEEEAERIVEEVISAMNDVGPGDFGKVMAAVMEKAGGRADGALISKIVKQKLN